MGSMKKYAQSKMVAEAPEIADPHASFVASAARVSSESFNKEVKRSRQAWQQDAYDMYNAVGEFRYACDWVGSMMSKALLVPTFQDNLGKHKPITEGPAFEMVSQLCNDDDGRAEMLRMIGIHMTISGECFLIGYDNTDEMVDEDQVWKVVAPTRINQGGNGGKYRVEDEEVDADPENVVLIRIWKQDPVNSKLAISPARALLPILGEILRLTQHVAAQVDSRLAGAGIFMVPSEMSFPAPPEQTDTSGNVVTHVVNDAESLMRTLNVAMAASIRDRSDPSALVPIVITAPAEAIAAARHITFWSELDSQAIELRTEAIRRLALGMDMPPEILQGTADANHWSAWQADESAIKAHTEPLLKIITAALSKGYLRPLLKSIRDNPMNVDETGNPTFGEELAGPELRRFSITADTANMRLRPNRSKEALELYEHGEISGKTLRRETGFSEDDIMSTEEMALWFRKKVASGSTTPELVEKALHDLKVFTGGSVIAGDSETTQEARPTPSLEDHPEMGPPDEKKSEQHQERKINADPGALLASLRTMQETA